MIYQKEIQNFEIQSYFEPSWSSLNICEKEVWNTVTSTTTETWRMTKKSTQKNTNQEVTYNMKQNFTCQHKLECFKQIHTLFLPFMVLCINIIDKKRIYNKCYTYTLKKSKNRKIHIFRTLSLCDGLGTLGKLLYLLWVYLNKKNKTPYVSWRCE